jgi:hypothetical protein
MTRAAALLRSVAGQLPTVAGILRRKSVAAGPPVISRPTRTGLSQQAGGVEAGRP